MTTQTPTVDKTYFPQLEDVKLAQERLKPIIYLTPLMKNEGLSEAYQANILLKREDLQVVRSYKIRGAFNKISTLSAEAQGKGVVCASAGNHAQGVAYSCRKLGIKGVIFMPSTTPSQKIKQVKMFGKEFIELVLIGDTFDDAFHKAKEYATAHGSSFIPPFDDEKVIEGQATVGMEILEQAEAPVDYLFLPVGGGGLSSGVGSIFKRLSPQTVIVGVEPEGAPAMKTSLENNENTELQEINSFVDGAAVKRVGNLNLEICKAVIDEMILVPEGKVCSTILKLYNEEAIVAEPAGALTISALDFYQEQIKGKNVVCVLSGGNNDITRTEEIKERSLLYEGLKHYFIVKFAQRAGALRVFVDDVLGPGDDIVHFEYSKKTSREKGPALVGIELQNAADFDALIQRMHQHNIAFEYMNEKEDLLQYLI